MCGITGIIDFENKTVDSDLLKKMTDLIQHRGPDGEGYFTDAFLGFGHRRLAIIDLDTRSNQPMTYRDRYTITYNGEIYNYRELKKALKEEGYRFETESDTEVLVAAYDHWGKACLHKFNGMWAFAIYDRDNKTVFCARDRFGIKPFYYFQSGSRLYFGSEIKQFTPCPEWAPVLNNKAAFEFLVYGVTDHDSETCFKGVNQLKGGYSLEIDLTKNKVKKNQWYRLSEELNGPFTGSEKEAASAFRDLFEDSVALRLRSDVPVGSCLSGGLDSSSIVAQAMSVLNGNETLETVSACSNHKEYDEQDYSDEVTNKYKNNAHKVFPQINMIYEQLDQILWHQEQPFSTTSIAAQWSVFEEAKKQGLIVMLDGQGADEQLAGYHHFYAAYFSSLLRGFRLGKLFSELRAFKNMHGYSVGHVAKYLGFGLTPYWIFSLVWRCVGKGAPKWLNIPGVKSDFLYQRRRNMQSVTRLSLAELESINLPMLLRFEDRNSMAHSIESRVPFLDYRLVSFVLSLPTNHKIKKGVTKYVLREAMKNILPKKIYERKDKMGFVTAENKWVQDHRVQFVSELKKAKQVLSPILKPKQFDKFVLDFESAKTPSSPWRIITLSRWVKLFGVEIVN